MLASAGERDSCTHLEYTNSVFLCVPTQGIWAFIFFCHNTWVKPVSYWNISEWRKLEQEGGEDWYEIKGEVRGTYWFKIWERPDRKMNENLSSQSWDKQVCSEDNGEAIWYMLLLALKGQTGHWTKRYKMLIKSGNFCHYPDLTLSVRLLCQYFNIWIYISYDHCK